MRLFFKAKDGGPESTVTGFWLIESKSSLSIVLLKFEGKSREAFHTHAFNAVSWLLKGQLYESVKLISGVRFFIRRGYQPSMKPIITPKNRFHKVDSDGTSWVLSFRGPWSKTWLEERPDKTVVLTNGRQELWTI